MTVASSLWHSNSSARSCELANFFDHAQNAHGLVSESIFDWFNREMAIFEEQYLSNQSELGHTILRVWKPYMRAFSYTKFCVTIPSIRWVTGKTSPDWENTVKYRIPARRGALYPEILHVTQNPFAIMARGRGSLEILEIPEILEIMEIMEIMEIPE